MTGRTEHGDRGWTDDTVVLPLVPAPGTAASGSSTDAAGGGSIASDSGAGSIARNSATMALGSIVSRVTGFLRTAAIGAAIGAKAVADDYNLANTLPNMVYELLLGGVLASVIVPVLVRARRTDADRGQAYAQRLLTLAVVFFGAASVLAVAAAPLFTAVLASHSSTAHRGLITALAYLLLPEIFFYGVAALFAAILNTRGSFAAPMWTPILNNIVVIATAGAFVLIPHTGPYTPESMTVAQIGVLGLGTTFGIVVQALGLVPALRRAGFRWRWRFDFRALGLRELGRLGSWMLLFVAVSQIGVFVVLAIAQRASDQGAPGPAIFNYAFLIFMMAHGIVAVSIITALLPRMSTAAQEGRYADLAAHLSLGTRLSAVILVPTAAAYIVLGQPLAITLFNWGHFQIEDARATGSVIVVTGVALVPYAISQLQVFAFYALSDTRTPALVNIPVVGLRLAIDVALYVLLPATAVVAGLMWGSTVSFVLGLLLGYWLLRRRVGPLGLAEVGRTLLRLGAAAGLAALPTAGVAWLLGRLLGTEKLGSLAQLTVGGLVLTIGYVTAGVLLRVPEIREVGHMLTSRLRRS